MRILRGFLVLGIIVSGTPARADLAVQASVDRTTVAVGETFRLTLEVSGASGGMAQPQLPAMPGLDVSPAGQTQNVQIVNGQMTASINFVYAVVPRTTGPHQIPALTMAYEGKTFTTQPITITVTAQPAGGGGGGGEGPRALYLDASVSKSRVFVGEQITYAIQVYRRVQFLSQPQLVWPSFTGFVTQDLGQKDSQRPAQGVTYAVTELRTALFPAAAGDYTIPPAQLRAAIADSASADPFAMFFQNGRNVTVASPAIKISVLPLPAAGRPAAFGGAVGSFHLDASLDHASVEAGRPVTLTVAIAGRGLANALREPAWPEIPGMRRYETLTDFKAQPGGSAVAGTKTFKVTLIPLNSGKLRLPSITYPVFDPEQKRYVTLRSETLTLSVKPGTAPAPGAAPLGAGLAGVRTVQSDIRFLKPATGRPGSAGPRALRAGYWEAQIPPLLLLCVGAGAALRRRRLARDPAGARVRGARRSAERRLAQAQARAAGGDRVGACVALHEAVVNFLADRWTVAAAGLTLADVEARLLARGATAAQAARLRALWDEADLVRYAPQAASSADASAEVAAARTLLDELEALL